MTQTAAVSDIDYTLAEMEGHIARFKDQKSSDHAFIDTRIPGHERESRASWVPGQARDECSCRIVFLPRTQCREPRPRKGSLLSQFAALGGALASCGFSISKALHCH
jgi:hypothetical protein